MKKQSICVGSLTEYLMLLKHLEDKGYTWAGGDNDLPTCTDATKYYDSITRSGSIMSVCLDDRSKTLTYCPKSYFDTQPDRYEIISFEDFIYVKNNGTNLNSTLIQAVQDVLWKK